MSFRGRLLLFFVIIVVVPMLAVALVLFNITADSENGKADSAIAQGLRSAGSIYESDRQTARHELARIAGDPQLAKAIRSGRAAAVRTELRRLTRHRGGIRAVGVYGTNGKPLAYAGASDAIAFAAGAPSTAGGRHLGLVLVSTSDAAAYAQQVGAVTGLDVRVLRSGRVLAQTVEGAGKAAGPKN